jgi:hypothetical protein
MASVYNPAMDIKADDIILLVLGPDGIPTGRAGAYELAGDGWTLREEGAIPVEIANSFRGFQVIETPDGQRFTAVYDEPFPIIPDWF